jgi:hypothetical protein
MADTVRFSVVLRSSGTPKVYLPLADPKQDKKPKSGPLLFTTTNRVTAIQELEVRVEARNKKEAGIKAAEAARSQSDLSSAKVETKVLRIEKTKTNDN